MATAGVRQMLSAARLSCMEQPGRYPVSKEARDLTSSGPLISHPNVRVWLKHMARVLGSALPPARVRHVAHDEIPGRARKN
jgi:hypothetical protein